MLELAIVVALLAYAVVVSQPLAYLFFLGKAQRELSAPAYIELRQRINAVMTKRISIVYLAALLALILQLVIAWRSDAWASFAAAAVALACLLVDAWFMLRENVPINGVVDGWSVTAYPADWETYRAKWFAIFAYREVVQLVGFVGLLIGAVA